MGLTARSAQYAERGPWHRCPPRLEARGHFFTFLIDARAVQIIYPNSKSFLILCGPDSDDVTRLGLGYVEGNTLL
jgi:hypothetical protein